MLRHTLAPAAIALLAGAAAALAQGPLTTAFTYQGQLNNAGTPANGLYDFHFRLYDSPSAGTQVGPTICVNNLSVTNGGSTPTLYFGAHLTAHQRFFRFAVRQDTGQDCSVSTGFTLLSPRQQLTAEPYALWAKTASSLSAPDGAPANAVYVDNAGNVGIGTTAPLTSLHVVAPASGEGMRIQGPASGVTNTAYLSFTNSLGTSLGYVGDGSTGDNTIFLGAYNSDVCLTTNGGRILTGTAAGELRLGAGGGDYRHFRIGGGNSDGFIYGSYPALGDGIHMGYNWYADAAGTGHVNNTGGQTSRLSVQYGAIVLATGGVNQAPIPRVDVDQNGTLHVLNGSGTLDVASYYPDPSPSGNWPQGTYPYGTPFSSAGAISLYGPAGNVRWGVRSRYNLGFSVFPNQGEMYMDDATGTDRISISVDGESGASYGFIGCDDLYCTSTKNFITPHPDHPDTDITYCCIEGPEAAMYLRGTAHLIGGRAHVDLPDTFSSLASKDGLTVILTPLSLDSRGLACTTRSINGFDVGELLLGQGNYDFDWEIKAVRRGFRDYQVTHPWTEHAHGNKPLDDLWKQRLADIERRDAKFAAEDARIGPRPDR